MDTLRRIPISLIIGLRRTEREPYREQSKSQREALLGDSASDPDPRVFVCKACIEGSGGPRPSACDLVGLYRLAFGYW